MISDYSILNYFQGEEESSGYAARLFHCSNASGRFRVEEILDFGQEDLEEDDVMILDAWTQLFVWVGATARKEEKHDAIKTAMVMSLRLVEFVHIAIHSHSRHLKFSSLSNGMLTYLK